MRTITLCFFIIILIERSRLDNTGSLSNVIPPWDFDNACLLERSLTLDLVWRFLSLVETVVGPCMYHRIPNLKYDASLSYNSTFRKASTNKWPCLRDALNNEEFVEKLGKVQQILIPCASNAPKLNLSKETGTTRENLKNSKNLGEWYYAFWWFWWYFLSRQVTFHLVQKNGPDISVTVYKKGSMFNEAFNRSKPTKIVIHGYKADKDSALGKFMRIAYYSEKPSDQENEAEPEPKVNLVFVNWANISKGSYILAQKRLIVVAAQVERFITRLVFEYGVTLNSIHIVGHSLGAHVSGITGRLVSQHAWTAVKWNITHKRGEKLGRITGLDPALPGFLKLGWELKIGKNAAMFVDVIHTSAFTFGSGEPLGHADFYVNGGLAHQPGCGLAGMYGITLGGLLNWGSVCSHSRAYYYYAESVVFPKAFPSRQCSTYTFFILGLCKGNPVVYMGEATPQTARGTFYLQTASKPFFGLGKKGII
uniref:Phospholipase A1 member A n=1 Tax=Lygus hesperus TaxID=30085 RepID=A0A0A9WB67_LYGHE